MRKKIIKWIGILIVLGLLGGGILLWNINPIVESFRPQLAKLISDTLQRPTEIGGIELKLFPTQIVELKGITLSGGGPEGARIERAFLDVNLFAIFKKRLEITQVAIDKLSVNVTREKDGSLKVGGLPLGKKEEPAKPQAPAPAPAGDQKPADPSPAQGSSISLQTNSVQLKKGKVVFQDNFVSPAQTISIDDIEVRLDNITKEAVEKFLITASILGKEKSNLKFKGSVKGLDKAPLGVEPDVTLSFSKIDTERLIELATAYGKKAPPVALKDTVDIEISAKGPVSAPKVELSFDGRALGVTFGELFQKPGGTPLALAATIEPKIPLAVELPKLDFTLGSSKISAPLSIALLNQSGKVKITSSGISLAELATMVPPMKSFGFGGSIGIDMGVEFTAPSSGAAPLPKINGAVELKGIEITTTLPSEGEAKPEPLNLRDLNGKIELAGDSVSIKGLKFTIAEQSFEIGTKVTNLPDAVLQYALRSNSITFAPLLAALKKGGIPALNSSSVQDLQVSGGFDKKARSGNIVLTVAKGELANLPLAAVKIAADFLLDEKNQPQRATLQPSTLGIFGGNVSFQGGLSAEKQITFQTKASGIDITKAQESFQPNGKLMATGTLESLNLAITASQTNIPGTISGPLTLSVVKGSIEGVNIVGQALGKITNLPGLGNALLVFVPEKYQPLFKSDRTAFDKFMADVKLQGPNVGINNFQIVHPAYTVSGQGSLSKNGDMDIRAELALSAELAAGMVAREPKLKLLTGANGSIVFPIQIIKQGGIPVVIPDISKLAKLALGNTAKEAAKQVINKGLDKVAPGLGGALDSLF